MTNLLLCREIGGLALKRNDQFRTLLIEDEMVAFTPTEYRLILSLLNGEMIADKTLVQAVFATDAIDRLILKNLEKHIENVKSKLRHTKLYIRRIHRYGYSLVAESYVERASTATF